MATSVFLPPYLSSMTPSGNCARPKAARFTEMNPPSCAGERPKSAVICGAIIDVMLPMKVLAKKANPNGISSRRKSGENRVPSFVSMLFSIKSRSCQKIIAALMLRAGAEIIAFFTAPGKIPQFQRAAPKSRENHEAADISIMSHNIDNIMPTPRLLRLPAC